MTQRREEMAILRVLDASSASSPETVFFEEMVAGWQSQRLSRNLSFATVEAGARVVTRFADAVGAPPWRWTTEGWERWVSVLRERDGLARSTVRSYGLTVASFLTYACDPAYGWSSRCLEQFGTHPVQICRPENLATHRTDTEASPSRRPLTKAECQALFDAADDRAASVRQRGTKGWVPAFRDSVMLKVAYAFGLRRRELVMLERCDFTANPKAPEFGAFGVCQVRFGKATSGSPPRRRGVLTVMPWSVEVLAEWTEEILPAWRQGTSSLWPSERGERVSDQRLAHAFTQAATRAGLPAGLSPHCLRHSYVTHLTEDGYDALFVQQQVGHLNSSTTAIYTAVSSDYRTRVLRAALDAMATTDTKENER
jgi:site-specific recombinase XerD